MNQEQTEKHLVELYQEWYDEINPIKADPDTIRYAKGPSFQTIKQIFKTWLDQLKVKENQDSLNEVRVWFENHKEILREKICPKWNDQSGKSRIQKVELVAIGLTFDGLAAALAIPTSAMITATILVVEGSLDHLCSSVDCSKE
ncbi:MAG: hypothetical protein KAI83_20080 [Thiomargarita sp.]|nr:hypothetical protein [Thiomargarita sp.]